jgi:hypothetical protein
MVKRGDCPDAMVNKPLAGAGGDDLGGNIMDEADVQMLAAITADRDYWECGGGW